MNNIPLRPVKRATKASNRYCGPSALSALTGLDTFDTARLLRHITGKRSIKGTSSWAMGQALKRLGISVSSCAHNARPFPTFVQWERASRKERQDNTYLLVVGNHWAAIKGRRYVCGLVKKPVPFSLVPHRRARVTEVFHLVRIQPLDTAVIPAPKPKAKANPNPSQTLAKALAARYGIQLESVSMYDRLNPNLGGVYVYPPAGLYDEDGENDPLNGGRIGFSWEEVLSNVEVYVADIQRAADKGKTLVDICAQPATLAPL